MKIRKAATAGTIVFILALFALRAGAQIPGMDMSEDVKRYLSMAIPPYIGAVHISPENPAAGEEIKVTATIKMIQITEEETTSVADALLRYTVDGGGTWQEVAMDQDGDNPDLWTAEIPGQDAGTAVEYAIKAVSDVGTINFDMSGRQISLNVGMTQGMELSPTTNLAGYDPGNPDDSPFEHLALISDDGGAPDENISPSADIREVRFGYDSDNFYFKLKFESKMDGGALSPLLARLYLGFFFDLNRNFPDYDATTMTWKDYKDKLASLMPMQDQGATAELAKRLSAWYWAPLLEAIPALPGIGKLPKETFIKLNPANIKTPIFDTTSAITERKDDGTLEIKAPRSLFGEDTDMLMFFFGDIEVTGNLADYTHLQFSIPDVCYPTIIKMAEHKFTVGS